MCVCHVLSLPLPIVLTSVTCVLLSRLRLFIPASPSCILAVLSGRCVFVGQSSCRSGVVQPELTLTRAACQILLWGSKVAVQEDLGFINCAL